MTPRTTKTAPLVYARIAGTLYLLIAVLSAFVHMYVPSELIVSGDATTTATIIMASAGLFRLNIAAELVILLSEVVLLILLYVLLKPVSATLSLVAMVSSLAMTTIHAVNTLNNAVVLLLLSGDGYITVFAPNQLHALVMLFLDAYKHGFNIGIMFLPLHCFILGYLMYQSGYFPRVLGILFVIAGVGYLLDSFALVLLAKHTTGAVYFALPIAIAEIAFPLWLLFKGVNAEQWEQRARESDRGENVLVNLPVIAPAAG
jgi:hypothetical protein